MFREETEWCQYYWFNTSKPELKRVLLIGDSIVVGYRGDVAEALKDKATVAAFSTSRIVGDPAFMRELAVILDDYPIDYIYFNNGLHGAAYDDEFYRRSLKELVEYLHLLGHKELYWRNSTPITVRGEPEKFSPLNEQVIRRNQIAAEVMGEFNIPIDDLYSLVYGRPELSRRDGFHYTVEAYTMIGQHVAETIEKQWL